MDVCSGIASPFSQKNTVTSTCMHAWEWNFLTLFSSCSDLLFMFIRKHQQMLLVFCFRVKNKFRTFIIQNWQLFLFPFSIMEPRRDNNPLQAYNHKDKSEFHERYCWINILWRLCPENLSLYEIIYIVQVQGKLLFFLYSWISDMINLFIYRSQSKLENLQTEEVKGLRYNKNCVCNQRKFRGTSWLKVKRVILDVYRCRKLICSTTYHFVYPSTFRQKYI